MRRRYNRELTTREKRFVDEYQIDFNGAKAAVRAGYSEATAALNAPQVLARPLIQQALAEKVRPLQTKNRRSADWVLSKIEHIVDLTSDEKRTHFNPRVALQGTEQLGRYHKLFTEKIEINVRDDLGDKVMNARQRAKIRAQEVTEIDAKTGDKRVTKTLELETDIDIEDLLG